VQSLDRGLSILEAVGQSAQPVPLKQLTALLGIDRSNAFRLANTLRHRRFLADADGPSTNALVLSASARKRRWRSVFASRKALLRSMPRSAVSCFNGTGCADWPTASRMERPRSRLCTVGVVRGGLLFMKKAARKGLSAA